MEQRMHRSGALRKLLFALLASAWTLVLLAADTPLTNAQKEEFMRNAKILRSHSAPKGVTDSQRVTLSDGTLTHDVHVQTIDQYKSTYQDDTGRVELNFKDTYKFNIAGWKMAQAFGLDDMVPPSVERTYQGSKAAFTWWVDDYMMDESDRVRKRLTSPRPNDWNAELAVMHVFDQLIGNTDPNMTNMLIDKNWRLWLIDHTRAFRLTHSLLERKAIGMCDRNLLARMKDLDDPSLEKLLGTELTKEEIKGLLVRRDVIVKIIEQKGHGGLFDRPKRN
jgi:hypothetical protein